MKKIYIILLVFPVLVWALSYLSVWGAIGAVLALIIFLVYRFFTLRLHSLQARNQVLEKELEKLHAMLEQAVAKEELAGQEAVRVRKSKQQLLSVINHEVRTPMNGILGSALLLQDTSLTKDQRDYVKTILACGEALLSTVNNILANDILEFSRMQEGAQLEHKDFNLRDAIEETQELLAIKARQAGLELIYYMEEDVPEQLVGDSRMFRQVLMNLLENAIKFTAKGEIFTAVSCTKHDNHTALRVEVRDTGTGISKEQLKHLFNGIPGKESANSSSLPGLGLVICKKLVEIMGGRIEATSEEGKGSSFIFNIPVTLSSKIIREHAHQDNMSKLEGKRVLIVDDNPTVGTVLTKQLKSWKMLPVYAATAKEALQLASNDSFDLVLIDKLMPDMDATQVVRSIPGRSSKTVAIAMDSSAPDGFELKSGVFSSVLSKPFRQYLLRQHLMSAITKPGAGKENTAGLLPGEFAQHFPLRILVAEDNLVNQKIAVKILDRLGYKAALANNGREAIELAGQEQFDVILMDVEMPEMNGLDATRMLRTCLDVQPVIIALTANTMQGDRDECMQAGMDDYMSKPIEMKELLSQLEKWALVIRERAPVAPNR